MALVITLRVIVLVKRNVRFVDGWAITPRRAHMLGDVAYAVVMTMTHVIVQKENNVLFVDSEVF